MILYLTFFKCQQFFYFLEHFLPEYLLFQKMHPTKIKSFCRRRPDDSELINPSDFSVPAAEQYQNTAYLFILQNFRLLNTYQNIDAICQFHKGSFNGLVDFARIPCQFSHFVCNYGKTFAQFTCSGSFNRSI